MRSTRRTRRLQQYRGIAARPSPGRGSSPVVRQGDRDAPELRDGADEQGVFALPDAADRTGRALYHRVKTFDPENGDAEWNMSSCTLWPAISRPVGQATKVRWKTHMRPVTTLNFSQPRWLGQDDVKARPFSFMRMKDLAIPSSSRYIPMLAARGARCHFRGRRGVISPAVESSRRHAECVPKPGAALPAFDLHCAIGSLPMAFGTRLDTIPS